MYVINGNEQVLFITKNLYNSACSAIKKFNDNDDGIVFSIAEYFGNASHKIVQNERELYNDMSHIFCTL